MLKKESPGGQARAKTKKGSEQATPFYPAAPAPVNQKCLSCQHFKRSTTGRWKRIFCWFTGESVSETWGCDHWAPSGGETI